MALGVSSATRTKAGRQPDRSPTSRPASGDRKADAHSNAKCLSLSYGSHRYTEKEDPWDL